MNEALGLRLVCEAALLENSAAVAFLCEQLDQNPAGGAGKQQLLLGLAWLAPEKAMEYYDADISRERQKYRQGYENVFKAVKRLTEAHQIHGMTLKEKEAYQTVTALLPPNSPEAAERQQIQQLSQVLAPEATEEIDTIETVVKGFVDNPILLARIWQKHGALLFNQPGNIYDRGHFFSIGQLALAARATQSDRAIVAALVRWRCRSLENSCTDSEAQVLLYTLDALETLSQEKLITLILEVLQVVPLAPKKTGVLLMARVLVLIARAGLETDKTIVPLLKHLSRLQRSEKAAYVWIGQVEEQIEAFSPVPRAAYALMQVLRESGAE